MFITFEGIDGCGKTTQIELLKSYFEENGFKVILIREPGSTKISEQIRDILLNSNNFDISSETETLLFASARSQVIKEIIIPSLNENKIVLCDRFIDSTIAYQGFGRGIDLKNIYIINEFAIQNIYPDFTFFIDITIEESINRLKGSNLDRMESAGNKFYNEVRKGYLDLASQFPERIYKLNGTLSIKDIHHEIISII